MQVYSETESETESKSEPECRPGPHAQHVCLLHPSFSSRLYYQFLCLTIGCTCMEDSIFGTSPLSGWRNSCGKILHHPCGPYIFWYSLNSQPTATKKRCQLTTRYVYYHLYTGNTVWKHPKAPSYPNHGTKHKSESTHSSTDTRTPPNLSIVSSGVKQKMS